MKVTLEGPDDLGFCVLSDSEGNTYPLVQQTEDYLVAARLFGWKGGTLDQAIDFVTERSGEEITAPRHIARYFQKLSAVENDDG